MSNADLWHIRICHDPNHPDWQWECVLYHGDEAIGYAHSATFETALTVLLNAHGHHVQRDAGPLGSLPAVLLADWRVSDG